MTRKKEFPLATQCALVAELETERSLVEANRELAARFEAGAVPMVLISSYRIYQEKFPHWVVVTGFDDHFVYVHDPFVDYNNGESTLDSINMPIQREEFSRMSR